MLTSTEILNWTSLPPDLSGQKVSILGMARSGRAAAQLLHKAGCHVFLSDSSNAAGMEAAAGELRNSGIECEVGGHTERVLDCDFLVRSPGIPATAPLLQAARKRKMLIVSEIEVASWFCAAPIVAVTGSNGKTTTVEWLGDLFRRAGKDAAVCGNVGWAFSDCAADLHRDAVAVVEISSFQLEDMVRFRPRVSVITNFSPDHLDRYDSYEHYMKTKCRIFENQSAAEVLVYNRADEELSSRVAKASARLLSFGLDEPPASGSGWRGGKLFVARQGEETELIQRVHLSLPGAHNLENALAVACVAVELGVPFDALRQSLMSFPGVSHRLENVLEERGVLWVNDSKATNIASGLVALDSFTRPIILLAGGRDKGSDFRSVAVRVSDRVRQVILFGEAGPDIEAAWSGMMSLTRVVTLEEAVWRAAEFAQKGDVVMLSPMCASFDEFDNYEQRGDAFKTLVREHVSKVK